MINKVLNNHVFINKYKVCKAPDNSFLHDKFAINNPNLFVIFGKGSIDDYCAYLLNINEYGQKQYYAPTDACYFERLKWLSTQSDEYTPIMLWNQFVELYGRIIQDISDRGHTGNGYILNRSIIEQIIKICDEFYSQTKELRLIAATVFLEIYFGMLAEEFRVLGNPEHHSDLGGLIKLNAIYKVLFTNEDIQSVCNCDRNRDVASIKSDLKKIGLTRRLSSPDDYTRFKMLYKNQTETKEKDADKKNG